MQYLLMARTVEDIWATMTPDQMQQGMAAYMAYNTALTAAGVLKSADRLAPTSVSATVRVVDGKTQVVDGPYAEAKEQFGGFFLLEVADLDAALAWAARCPAASHGAVEVRQIWANA